MARAKFVKAAAKDYPAHEIKKGESYFWWKFRFGGKHYSKTAPRAAQLTSSEFLSTVYDLNDELSEFSADTLEALRDGIADFVSRIQDLSSETEDKLNNMPDSLQQGPTGELLQSRIDSLSDMESNLDSIDADDIERVAEQSAEEHEEEVEKALSDGISEVNATSYDGE